MKLSPAPVASTTSAGPARLEHLGTVPVDRASAVRSVLDDDQRAKAGEHPAGVGQVGHRRAGRAGQRERLAPVGQQQVEVRQEAVHAGPIAGRIVVGVQRRREAGRPDLGEQRRRAPRPAPAAGTSDADVDVAQPSAAPRGATAARTSSAVRVGMAPGSVRIARSGPVDRTTVSPVGTSARTASALDVDAGGGQRVGHESRRRSRHRPRPPARPAGRVGRSRAR